MDAFDKAGEGVAAPMLPCRPPAAATTPFLSRKAATAASREGDA
jgi:hypothetical protein